MAGTVDLTNYKRYLRSGCWKCPNAPINPDLPLNVESGCGAHYWEEHDGIWVCKYCYDVRKKPMSFQAAMVRQQTTKEILLIRQKGGIYG